MTSVSGTGKRDDGSDLAGRAVGHISAGDVPLCLGECGPRAEDPRAAVAMGPSRAEQAGGALAGLLLP